MKHAIFGALALACALLSGCAGTIASAPAASSSAAAPASATPKSQIDTFAGAENAIAATGAGVTILVRSGKSTPAQRATIRALEQPIKAAVAKLRDDRDHGRPLVFDALNAAIDALNAFVASPGA